MAKCSIHSGLDSVFSLYGKNYCAKCKTEIEQARKAVRGDVVPKECFIEYRGTKDGWKPISGTGCAHWVAHQKGIHKGSKADQCLAGYTMRVPIAISGKNAVVIDKVQVGDLYATPQKDHMGIVVRVGKAKIAGQPRTIMIEHDSSGQGGLATNEFAQRFHSKGTFYR